MTALATPDAEPEDDYTEREPEPQSLADVGFALRRIRDCRSRIAEHTIDAERMREKLRRELEQVDHWLDQETAADRREEEPEPGIDIGRADWHARKLQMYASQRSEISATARAEIERLQRWEHEQLARISRREQWHRATLQAFHAAWWARTKEAAFSLPCGAVLRRRAQQPEYARDEPTLRAWAAQHGLLREPKPPEPVADWARIKAAAKRGPGGLVIDGELVPGVAVRDREPEWLVEVGDNG